MQIKSGVACPHYVSRWLCHFLDWVEALDIGWPAKLFRLAEPEALGFGGPN
jgi:hypothetical protein